ncbi:MAG: alpha/beta hydrolase [Anaerolineales bacterium]
MSALLLEGQIIHYEVLGRGRPIIFLHGWVGSWRYWISSMQIASTSFRAYALDFWGFGDTARDPQKYSLNQQADLLNRFLDDLGIAKVAIVGHGLGALVGFTYASRWPTSVDRVMAVSCPLSYEAINTRLRTSPAIPDLVNWLGSRTPEAASALSDASKVDPQAVTGSINSFQSNGLFGKMRETQIPTLLVYGQNDPAILTPDFNNEYKLPHMMHRIELEGVGHFPMLDNPSRFNRLLTDFLALDSGISPQELQLKEEWKRRVR